MWLSAPPCPAQAGIGGAGGPALLSWLPPNPRPSPLPLLACLQALQQLVAEMGQGGDEEGVGELELAGCVALSLLSHGHSAAV